MRTSLLVLILLLLLLLVGAPTAAPASTSDLVVGEIYAGGGNSGATYANDYIELFNRGAATVDVTGWTLQYASSSSTAWEPTPLTGTIAPGGHYLVALASGGAVGATLPAADATGTTNLALAGGKVAVVSAATALACSPCTATTSIHDLVGYGTANDHEGTTAAPALTSTTALTRAAGGCTDTNDNGADFATAAPSPSNVGSAATACGAGSPAGSPASVAVALDLQPVLTLALDRASLSFGNAVGGSTPAPATVTVTVGSSNGAGYALTVHRTPFTPGDLPLGAARAGSGLAAIPIAPAADLQLATTTAPSAPAGDVWSTSIGFLSSLPVASSGHYTTTVTYTVIGR